MEVHGALSPERFCVTILLLSSPREQTSFSPLLLALLPGQSPQARFILGGVLLQGAGPIAILFLSPLEPPPLPPFP